MLYRLLADAAVVLHAGFVVFVVLGAFLGLRWRWVLWLQVPAAVWGAWIEFSGAICPLTYLENHWLGLAGEAGYGGGFIEHYLLPVLYPGALTRETQWVLGASVIALNATAYGLIWRHSRAARSAQGR